MTQLSVLSRAVKSFYENDRILSKLSNTVETEIANNSLVLNDLDLHPDEIPCLCRFLSGKEVCGSCNGMFAPPYSINTWLESN